MVLGIRKKVLAVDDDRSMVAFLEMLITQMGHDFVGLHSGEDCLAPIDDIQPHLLLLDVSLTGMNGYDTCRRIRTEHSHIFIAVQEVTDVRCFQ